MARSGSSSSHGSCTTTATMASRGTPEAATTWLPELRSWSNTNKIADMRRRCSRPPRCLPWHGVHLLHASARPPPQGSRVIGRFCVFDNILLFRRRLSLPPPPTPSASSSATADVCQVRRRRCPTRNWFLAALSVRHRIIHTPLLKRNVPPYAATPSGSRCRPAEVVHSVRDTGQCDLYCFGEEILKRIVELMVDGICLKVVNGNGVKGEY
nr:hypothetical protein Iba_chr13aCG8460 [Ipomoea batatas]